MRRHTSANRILRPMAALLLLIAASASLEAAQWTRRQRDAVTAFKEFLKFDRPIKDLVAYYRVGNETNVVTIHARIQTNSFVTELLFDPLEEVNFETFVGDGHFDKVVGGSFDQFWLIGKQALFLSPKPRARQLLPIFPNNNAHAERNARLGITWVDSLVSCLGIAHALPRTISWCSETEFEAATNPDIKNPEIRPRFQGRIERMGELGIEEIVYWSGTRSEVRFVVRYEYSTNHPGRLLPYSARRFVGPVGNETFLTETVFKELVLGVDESMGPSGYTPDQFMKGRSIPTLFIYSNAVTYLIDPNGEMKVPGQTEPEGTNQRSPGLLLGSVVIGLTICFVVFAGWNRVRQG